MTLFRNKHNGMLYLIARVTPKHMPGVWFEAEPYNHTVPAYVRRKEATLRDFEKVAVI